MPRLRDSAGAGPPPKTSLTPPPNLSELAQLMWLNQDTMEDITESQLRHQRSSDVEPDSAPPPTPKMRQSRPAIPLALEESEPLDLIAPNANIVSESEHENGQRGLPEERTREIRSRGRDTRRQSASSSSSSNSGKQGTELVLDSRRRSRSQDDKRIVTRTASDKDVLRARERTQHAQGNEGGILKPLTPLPSASEQQVRKPGNTRKRSVSIARLNPDQINKSCREEVESMTEDPYIRGYATTSQEELYGTLGMSDVTNDPLMQRYLEPTRDTDEINRALNNMAVNEHDYRVGGPPGPVDIYNVDYDTDVSEIQGRAEFEHAREAKAFAAYAMYTDRQEEIDMLHRMQEHGYLKEGIEIKDGFQEVGPHGSIAWLTHEVQEIGGKLREEYEREKTISGKLQTLYCGWWWW